MNYLPALWSTVTLIRSVCISCRASKDCHSRFYPCQVWSQPSKFQSTYGFRKVQCGSDSFIEYYIAASSLLHSFAAINQQKKSPLFIELLFIAYNMISVHSRLELQITSFEWLKGKRYKEMFGLIMKNNAWIEWRGPHRKWCLTWMLPIIQCWSKVWHILCYDFSVTPPCGGGANFEHGIPKFQRVHKSPPSSSPILSKYDS